MNFCIYTQYVLVSVHLCQAKLVQVYARRFGDILALLIIESRIKSMDLTICSLEEAFLKGCLSLQIFCLLAQKVQAHQRIIM